MRNLFLALVLANLAFAAWQWWFAQPLGSEPAAINPQVPTITLVSELDSDVPIAAEAELSTSGVPAIELDAPTAAEPTQRCVSIGPFRELSQAATAAANLRVAGYEPSQRVAEGEIWVGYWVHLAGIPTRAEAEEILANLRENGVSDSYIVPGGEEEQIISLGVFSEISRAGRRREEVRRLDYDPTVVDRNRRGTVYWIDVTLAGDQALDLEPLQTPGRIIRLEQRGCQSPRG